MHNDEEERSFLSLDHPLFYGRSFEEYCAMFALEAEDWEGKRMLDCPGGPSSFVAEAHERGCKAYAADLLYGQDCAALRERGERDLLTVTTQVLRIGFSAARLLGAIGAAGAGAATRRPAPLSGRVCPLGSAALRADRAASAPLSRTAV